MKKTIFLLLTLSVLSCDQGLQPVTGFEGVITLPVDTEGKVLWPDSLSGAAVVFADISDIEGNPLNLNFTKLVQNITGYTDPLDTAQATQSYFLEAYPGDWYVAGVIATTVPVISLLGLPADSLAAHPEYFRVIGVYKSSGSSLPFKLISVTEDKITSGVDISCKFDFQF